MSAPEDDAMEKWREAGRITAKARDLAASLVTPGRRLEEVADKVEGFIRASGARPAFPLNLSADHWAAHYTPEIDDPTTFQDGQIVKVDIGAHVDGYPGDSATTVEVGGTRRHGDLIRASKEALAVAVEMIGPDVSLTKVGEAIELTIKSFGLRPIANLTGHLIKRFELHAGKSVPNVASKRGDVARSGEVFAIEPFATSGQGAVENGQSGNIYRFVGKKRVKDADAARLLEGIEREFSTLPFAGRWCKGLCEDPRKSTRLLKQAGALYAYPVLIEAGWGPVSQHEHSVLITPDGAVQLT